MSNAAIEPSLAAAGNISTSIWPSSSTLSLINDEDDAEEGNEDDDEDDHEDDDDDDDEDEGEEEVTGSESLKEVTGSESLKRRVLFAGRACGDAGLL